MRLLSAVVLASLLLARIASAAAPPCDEFRRPLAPMPFGQSAAGKPIEQQLCEPVTCFFDGVPLREVIDHFSNVQGINIVVDTPALQEAGISLDSPISIKLSQVLLKSALTLILQQAHLRYVIKDEVLIVTTEAQAHGKPVTATYQVADLLIAMPKHKPVTTKDTLIGYIVTTVAPQSWRPQGGEGTISYDSRTMSLIIQQTPDLQEQVCDLLAALRRLAAPDEQDQPAGFVRPPQSPVP